MWSKGTLLAAAGVFVLGLMVGGWWQRGQEGPAAFGQPMRGGSAGGVMAFTGQIDRDAYGIVMVDVDAGTLWVYQMNRGQLKLAAARSWMYDRYLEEYNCAAPTPSEVSQLVAGQQQGGVEPKKLEKAPAEPLE